MNEKISFEQALARIEAIVKQLERGDTPLEESLRLFEEGTSLIRGCGKKLEDAEQVVVKLMKGADGQPEEAVFTDDEK